MRAVSAFGGGGTLSLPHTQMLAPSHWEQGVFQRKPRRYSNNVDDPLREAHVQLRKRCGSTDSEVVKTKKLGSNGFLLSTSSHASHLPGGLEAVD